MRPTIFRVSFTVQQAGRTGGCQPLKHTTYLPTVRLFVFFFKLEVDGRGLTTGCESCSIVFYTY